MDRTGHLRMSSRDKCNESNEQVCGAKRTDSTDEDGGGLIQESSKEGGSEVS